MRDLLGDIRQLLDAASLVHAGTVDGDRLALLRARLDEPLRIAIAGRVKAGKSTLLNALVRDAVAPTDAGECTRLVTWYRHGDAPRVVVHPRTGEPRPIVFRKDATGIRWDLGDLDADEVDRAVVDWPSAPLRSFTLIDTPGADSIHHDISRRAHAALAPDDGEVGIADAVVYVMRHVHSSDLRFLEAFAPAERGWSSPLHCVGVLGRADEVGVARLDAMETAARVADRYSADPRLRTLCATVVPVSGLLAQAAATLTEDDLAVLRSIAAQDRARVDDLLLDATTFVGEPAASELGVGPATCAGLLDRFGLWGVRLAVHWLRDGGVASAGELSARLDEASGIRALQRVLLEQLAPRRTVLKARAALAGLALVVGDTSDEPSRRIAARAEQTIASSHELTEAALLVDLRTTDLGLGEHELDAAERLLGGAGHDIAQRLGVDPWTTREVRETVARSEVERWRRRAEHPFNSPATTHAARVLARAGEALVRRSGTHGTEGGEP